MVEDPGTGHLCLTFKVIQKDDNSESIMPGTEALTTLRHKISSARILDYSIARLDLLGECPD